jgi:hypothetical protein
MWCYTISADKPVLKKIYLNLWPTIEKQFEKKQLRPVSGSRLWVEAICEAFGYTGTIYPGCAILSRSLTKDWEAERRENGVLDSVRNYYYIGIIIDDFGAETSCVFISDHAELLQFHTLIGPMVSLKSKRFGLNSSIIS